MGEEMISASEIDRGWILTRPASAQDWCSSLHHIFRAEWPSGTKFFPSVYALARRMP